MREGKELGDEYSLHQDQPSSRVIEVTGLSPLTHKLIADLALRCPSPCADRADVPLNEFLCDSHKGVVWCLRSSLPPQASLVGLKDRYLSR